MKKPSKKSEWVDLAKKLKVVVDAPDTVPEIIKNIADKLGVSSRGKNFKNRVWDAAELALIPAKVKAKPEAKAPIKVKNSPKNIEVKKEETPAKPKFKRSLRAKRFNPMNFNRG